MAPSKDQTAAPADDTAAPAEDESRSVGDLVELHDGRIALVVAVGEAPAVVPLGHPVPYELPTRRVLG